MERNIFLRLLPQTLLPPSDLSSAIAVFAQVKEKHGKPTFFFFLIERGRHLLFLHPTTWRDIPLPQGSCNSTATAQEKRRRAHFPLLPLALFRQTWQLAVTSRRAGSERTGVSPLWLDSFFTPFQPLMFPSKWSTDPFVYRLQRPLGETKPDKRNLSSTNTGSASLFPSFWMFYNTGGQNQSRVRNP